LHLVGGIAAASPRGASVTVDTRDECLAAVRSGRADAFVADWRFDLGALPADLRALADAPFVGVAGPAVDPSRPGSATLLAAVDAAIDGMRSDGSLRALAMRRFGGADLSVLPGT
jgi:ABC-type amino acid transport substrate-binding protein